MVKLNKLTNVLGAPLGLGDDVARAFTGKVDDFVEMGARKGPVDSNVLFGGNKKALGREQLNRMSGPYARRTSDISGDLTAMAEANLGNAWDAAKINYSAAGGNQNILQGAIKGAALGGIAGGTLNVAQGENFWEGAASGAIGGGAIGGGIRGARAMTGARKGELFVDSASRFNRKHNVGPSMSQSLQTMLRDSQQAVASNSMLRNSRR